jgi:CelD/BcsL family acetyltransferase involved in cellulose biosynthesis
VAARLGSVDRSSRASGALRVETLRGDDAVAALDASWDRLVSAQGVPNPTLSSAWLRETARLEPGTPMLVRIREGDELVAGAALGLRRLRSRGPRVVGWLGRQFELFFPDFVAAPEDAHLAERLLEVALSEAQLVYLYETSRVGLALQAVDRRVPHARISPWRDCLFVDLPPPRLERLERKQAYELRRAERLGAAVAVRVLREPDEVVAGLDRFFELHGDRWQGREHGDNRFRGELEQTWYRGTFRALAERDAVRIVEALENGTVVASQLNLLHGRGALFLATATRVGGAVRGPGHVVMLRSATEAHEAGAEVMNLGAYAEDPGGPKDRLGPFRVPSCRALIVRSRTLQGCVDLTLGARRWVRTALGKEPPRQRAGASSR